MRHIAIQECYESLKIGNSVGEYIISNKEADELYQHIIKQKLDKNNIIWGRDTITFINYVGYIRLSTIEIEILPKVSLYSSTPELERKVLLNMLVRCGILKVDYSILSNLNNYKISLNEILALLFAKKLQKELSKGPYYEYIYVKDNSPSLKGSLLINQQIKNISSGNPNAFCRYEEFSMDNFLNQFLSYAVRLLLKEVRNPETLKLLRHIQGCFVDITEREVSNIEITNYKFNRLNSRFEEVFILAKMIIFGYSSLGQSGGNKSFSMLFKMNDIFEKYIYRILKRTFNDTIIYWQHSKYRLLKNEDTNRGIFNLIPDIVIEKEGKETIIIDTKWKSISENYNRHGVKRDDIYQMYAYLTRYKSAKSVILLYPRNENIEDGFSGYLESWHLEDNIDKKIRVYTLDLSSEINTIESLTRMIKENS